MAVMREPKVSTKIPYQSRQLLSQYGPAVSTLIERRLFKRVEFDGRLRWEGLFEAIAEVFEELGEAPRAAAEQDPEGLTISIDQHR